MFYYQIFIFLFSVLIFSNQNVSAQGNVEIIEVLENRAFCETVAPQKCLQVKRENQKEFSLFYDEIENFEFIAGYRYFLKVEVEKMSVIPRDTSGFKYYLKEIIKREKVLNQNPSDKLNSDKWILRAINGKLVESDKPYVLFDLREKTVSGFLGCNRFSGQFETSDDSIKFSKLISTKRACGDLQSIETPFSKNLGEAEKFKVETDRLYLYKNGVVILEFRASLS